MKKTIRINEFASELESNFSYNGAMALLEYLEDIECEMNMELEFDAIEIRCTYTEYENFEELKNEHENIEDMDALSNITTVIKIDDTSFIIQDF